MWGVLVRYVAAVQAGDADAKRELFAEDATWTIHAGQLAISGTWAGRDAIIDEFLAKAMAHSPGWSRLTSRAPSTSRSPG
jgi:ketosteroid isomerase-like protein